MWSNIMSVMNWSFMVNCMVHWNIMWDQLVTRYMTN